MLTACGKNGFIKIEDVPDESSWRNGQDPRDTCVVVVSRPIVPLLVADTGQPSPSHPTLSLGWLRSPSLTHSPSLAKKPHPCSPSIHQSWKGLAHLLSHLAQQATNSCSSGGVRGTEPCLVSLCSRGSSLCHTHLSECCAGKSGPS